MSHMLKYHRICYTLIPTHPNYANLSASERRSDDLLRQVRNLTEGFESQGNILKVNDHRQ